ncbi:GntR family transcriptional regulator [Kosakonia oryzae]|uniref:GntR family transcriptional regulator n=1 Tax=Kosakonia oryzae TaxID=497725 RepID=A0AA94H757_9ENTR|nr:GntR family transcriptional regulator [Kosakonia oryzae]ANI80619.1 GntR family transcriptional regulator [Kosakonia oryzae]UDJ82547.1 GntR family transcriptional regulator [Kosakonia oryzae]SFD16100.1 GntR family transcriptional regulator, glv operon transcriptional regulator [Kosakonia oryzae]
MIYKSIAERLRLRLNSSDYNIGSPLPGEKALALEFGVARMTIRKAVDLLVGWGLVVRRHGSGTFVARKDVHHETTNLTGLVEVLRRQGKEVQSQVLQFEVMPAPPAIASQLRIHINERIYFSRRVRYVEGKPLMLEDSYMPVKLFRSLSLGHLEGSKFDYIEKECGITISGNYESLTPVLADKQVASLLNVAEQTPLLRITSLSYSDSGEFLNYSVMFRNTSEYQVDYHLRRIHTDTLLTHPPEQYGQKLWGDNT